ncbi:MAG TPA: choice-of-anchor Q domain-containing protein [Candidatus Acidoferrum sp.]|nr:choice-of-anchor Q domain-containing protein [Candidatus Acidoferrum sp.]
MNGRSVSVPFAVTLVFLFLALGGVGQAAEFSCQGGDAGCLASAIRAANAVSEPSTIHLAGGTYALRVPDNDTNGWNGLPSVTGVVTIRGSDAARTIIERADTPLGFRLLHVASTATLTLEGLTLRGGLAAPDTPVGLGGGILNDRGRLTLRRVRVTGHTAAGISAFGGGVFNNMGTLVVTSSTIDNNMLKGGLAGGGGGGLATSGGSLTVSDSTIVDNEIIAHVAFGGGAADISSLSTSLPRPPGPAIVEIVNTTIARNAVGGFGAGGAALAVSPEGRWAVSSSTIAGNAGSGISVEGGSPGVFGVLTLRNTIVAQNSFGSTLPGDCAGPITSLDYNIIENVAGCTVTLQAHDRTGAARLAVYTDDGEPGRGHWPLLPDSQAIDAGDEATCPTADQLGRLRRGRCEIGAAEFFPDPAPLPDFVVGFYRYVLGREPDPAETAGWLSFLRAEPTVARARVMTHAFFDGPEYRGRPFTPTGHSNALYRAILGRDGDPVGQDGWVSSFEQRRQSLPGLFVNSSEFHTVVPDCHDEPVVRALIIRIYQQALRRTPANEEVNLWMFTFSTNCQIEMAVNTIFNLAEYTDAPRTLAEQVEVLYRALLARVPSPAEVTAWVEYLAPPSVEDQFIDSPEFAARWQQLTRP